MGTEAYLIDDVSCISPEMIKKDICNIGITAGASAPEELVQEVIEYFCFSIRC